MSLTHLLSRINRREGESHRKPISRDELSFWVTVCEKLYKKSTVVRPCGILEEMTQEYTMIPDLSDYDTENLRVGVEAGKGYMKNK